MVNTEEYSLINNTTMDKYRVIITNKHDEEVLNHVYEIPSGASVVNTLLETEEFFDDVAQIHEDIMDPTLNWNIYLESPIEIDKGNFIHEIGKELIYNNLDMERLSNTIYELLDEIGLHKLDEDLKKYLIKHIEFNL